MVLKRMSNYDWASDNVTDSYIRSRRKASTISKAENWLRILISHSRVLGESADT